MLFYLGSLGRTNSDEVNDKDLTRVCPVINLSDLTDSTLQGYQHVNINKTIHYCLYWFLNILKPTTNLNIISFLDLFSKFDYVFNGHMHKACSRFILTDEETGKETMLFYLGSLGRTNSYEVNIELCDMHILCLSFPYF